MNLSKQSLINMPVLHRARKEQGSSERIAITHLISPHVFECQNGQVGSVIRVQGISSDTVSNDILNSARRTWHHGLSCLDESFFVMVHTIRRRLNVSLEGEFDNAFCEHLDERYHQKFKASALYTNDLYITVLYKGLDSGGVGKLSNIVQRFSRQALSSAREAWRAEAVSKLQKSMDQLIATLLRFEPHVLGLRDDTLSHSELLSFLGLLVNGGEFMPFNAPASQPSMARHMDDVRKNTQKYPQGHIGQYIASKRIFFGRYIEMQSGDHSARFGAILTIKRYPEVTASVLLDKLLHLDAEFISTHSFAVEAQAVANQKVERQYTKLVNSNDKAGSQIAQLGECQDDLASDRYKAGYHHHGLFLLADSIPELQARITRAIKHYADSGIVAFHDVLGQMPLFWAQIPGNQRFIVRAGFVTSKNFVDFVSLHNCRTGYREQNHLGSAVSLIETPSKTPMFFNYHAKGSGKRNDLTPGHTAIIGGNGSGKTVFECFMDAQMTRYGGRSFFFDRDRGTEIYIRACGGVCNIISPNHPEDVQFNPFSVEDTPQNRQFLKAWMGELVREAGEEELPAPIESAMSGCVDYAYDALSTAHRYLSNVVKLLPVDFPRWSKLNKWLRGDEVRNDGDYAYLFDHDTDHLDLNATKMGFDLTDLMKQPACVTTLVMMYLFHRLELSLDGSRVSVCLAEGWQYLNHPFWVKKLASWLPTLRKLNCHIVLDTQSPKSVVNSPVSAEYLDNSACSIFFCNDKADEAIYSQFNITASEFDFIKNTPKEKRLFLYKQGHESAICKLDLSGMSDVIAVLSGNKESVDAMTRIRSEVGNHSDQWLPEFYAWQQENQA